MQPIRSVAILGAGAMGAMYLAHFQRAGRFEVLTPAIGTRAARLRAQPLTVNGEAVMPTVFEPGVDSPPASPVDLVLVSVKHHQLEQALELVRPIVSSSTLYLSVLNGLDSEDVIAVTLDTAGALPCIALGMDAVREAGEVRYSRAGCLTFGEARNEQVSARVAAVQNALGAAGLEWDTPVDMRHAMWWKFMVNVGINQTSAMCRAPYEVARTNPDTRALMQGLIDEVVTLSHLEGAPLDHADVTRWYSVLDTLGGQAKTSMLQDVEAGRRTEVDIFAGKVVRLGERHGVPTPFNRVALHTLRALERDAPG